MPGSGRVSEIIGRDEDLSSLLTLLNDERLVTLVGAPGVGKTTLARAAAAAQGKVLWVGLRGTVDDGDAGLLLASEMARAGVGTGAPDAVRDAWGVPRWTEHVAALGAATVVLDECEFATSAASRMAELLLEASDTIRVLATSRHPLETPDEVLFHVRPLGAPSLGAPREVLQAHPALRILSRSVDQEDLDALAHVARAVDGIPLALILARELLKTFSPRQVADRIRGSSAALLPLEGALKSSWEPLEAPARIVLGCASLFEGAFTLDWLEDALPPERKASAVPTVEKLVKRSLLVREDGRTGARFRVLAVLRQYVLSTLAASGDLEALRRAFEESILGRAEHTIAAEDAGLHLDLAALVERALEAGRFDQSTLRGLTALSGRVRFHWEPARISALTERSLQIATNPSLTCQVRALWATSLATELRLTEAVQQAELALADARSLGDGPSVVRALSAVADMRARAGQIDAAWEALTALQETPESRGTNESLLATIGLSANVEWRIGRAEEVWKLAVSGLAAAERTGEPRRAALFRLLIGQACAVLLRFDESERFVERVEREAVELDTPALLAAAKITRGLSRARQSDPAGARRSLNEAVETAQRGGLRRAELWASAYLGAIDYIDTGSAALLEDTAVRVDLDEPLLLLIPLFASLAGSTIGTFLLEDGLKRVGAALPGSVVLRRMGKAFAAARAGDREALLEAAATLPPAFQPDLALCVLMLSRRPAVADASLGPALHVATDGSWFEAEGKPRVSLTASPTSRKLLARLLIGHERGEGSLTLEQLREAAWPGDRSLPDAAANRVYVSLSRLRERGLRDVIERDAKGWRISQAVRVRRA
ncbi:MAG: hypothetical protein JNL21_13005 [Myxococcales bacterium]|nr:hypothetical protein [Myxococcales bacterium]